MKGKGKGNNNKSPSSSFNKIKDLEVVKASRSPTVNRKKGSDLQGEEAEDAALILRLVNDIHRDQK